MALLEALTRAEADRLWWKLIRSAGAVCDELDHLDRAPEWIRGDLYGGVTVAQYRGMRDDILQVITEDLQAGPLPDLDGE